MQNFIYTTQLLPVFCIALQHQRGQCTRDLHFTIDFISWVLAVLTAFLSKNTDFLTELILKKRKIYFHKHYLSCDRQSLSTDFLFGYTSYLPLQWSEHKTQQAVQQETALFFLWSHQGSKQTFLFFFFILHGQREHTKALLKPQKQQLLKFWVQQV